MANEPIAIVGIGCQLPGGVHDPASYWRLLADGVDAIDEIPADRWSTARFFKPSNDEPGSAATKWGGFVRDMDRFDATFFGISPREALHVDPQQRLLLQTSWAALEDAGFDVATLAGSRAGVYVGIATGEYWDLQLAPANRRRIDAYTNLGGSMSIAANRISYTFDLRGPSLSVDTACSSSLVAAHLACQAIWADECDLAVVGGVNAILKPEVTIGFSKAHMLSPDGRCKAFDARANGYVRAEGAGTVVLKRLSRARADRDRIYAVVAATSVNQDGRSDGITVPVVDAQAALLERAYNAAEVDPRAVAYIEAHGTGTPVGDPIEARAIGRVVSRGRADGDFCHLGSVKTNIGHLEAGAGIAGLIKAALVINRRAIPANLHFRTPNPAIAFDDLRLRVPTGLVDLSPSMPAIAGVNSFGFGGTNAHAVLIEHRTDAPEIARRAASPQLFVVSAKSEPALKSRAANMVTLIDSSEGWRLDDLAYSATARKSLHEHRLALVVDDLPELRARLAAYVDGRDDAAAPLAPAHVRERTAFVFTGMGPQRWAMGRELFDTEPVYRSVIERCDTLLRRHGDWSLVDELRASEAASRMRETQVAQPANFALQVGLTALLRHWGIEPEFVVGHSTGEVAAAHVSGALTLEDAIQVIHFRSALQQRTAGSGTMLAAGLSLERALELTRSHGRAVAVAAVNGPRAVTLAGNRQALEAVAAELAEQGCFVRFLDVDIPYHSAQMEPIRDALNDALRSVRAQPPAIPVLSTVSGGVWAPGDFGGAYWWHNVREAVQFARAADVLLARGVRLFVEVGPHPVLSAAVKEAAGAKQIAVSVLPTLRRDAGERFALLKVVADLAAKGHRPAWAHLFADSAKLVSLPPYPFAKERYWDETPDSVADRTVAPMHPLLGSALPGPNRGWDNFVAPESPPFLDEHRVGGNVVFPGAVYLEMALACARAVDPTYRVIRLQDVQFKKALMLQPGARRQLRFALASDGVFDVYSKAELDESEWTLNAQGRLLGEQAAHETRVALADLRASCSVRSDADLFYARLAAIGLDYGPSFRCIRHIRVGERRAVGSLDAGCATNDEGGRYVLHPGLIDSCMQTLFAALPAFADATLSTLFLPVAIREFVVYRCDVTPAFTVAQLTHASDRSVSGDIDILAADGRRIAAVRELTCRVTAPSAVRSPALVQDRLYVYDWVEASRPSGDEIAARALAEVAAELAEPWEVLKAREQRNRYYEAVEPQLGRLTHLAVVEALQRLGVDWRVGQRVSASTLISDFAVVDSYRPLCSRLLAILAEAGWVEATPPSDWRVRRTATTGAFAEEVRNARSTFLDYDAELQLIERCGSGLAGALRADTSPLQLLFPDGVQGQAFEFYAHSTSFRIYNDLLVRALRSAFAAQPQASLRILEVGAGTGGLTQAVLQAFGDAPIDYTYTDVSPAFVSDAQRRFADDSRIRCRVLDIERDFAEQGLGEGFDVVLAADVLHVVRDIEAAARRIHAAVKPGGVLAFIESTRPTPWVDLVFGLTEGWWRFRDARVAAGHPLISGAEWKRVLEGAGFTEALAVSDGGAMGDGLQSVLMGRKEVTASLRESTSRKQMIVLLNAFSTTGERLGDALRRSGHSVSRVGYASRFGTEGAAATMDPDVPAHHRSLLAWAARHDTERTFVLISDAVGDMGHVPPAELCAASATQTLRCLYLVQALAAASIGPRRLCVVARGAERDAGAAAATELADAPLWGLLRSVKNEHAQASYRIVELAGALAELDFDAVALEISGLDADEREVRLTAPARRFVHRLRRLEGSELSARSARSESLPNNEPFSLQMRTAGNLATLRFERRPRALCGPQDVLIQVRAAALNFKDVMLATGALPEEAVEQTYTGLELGMECAGTVAAAGALVIAFAAGDEVLAIAKGALGSMIVAPEHLVRKKPVGLTWAQAAGLAVAGMTASYALDRLARLQPGETVLIHAGSGGVGLCAISLAQSVGATVIATGGSDSKREFLRARGVHHVFDSRSLAFAEHVLSATGGRGVDVVLNSLSGDSIAYSLAALAPYGRLVELGKSDIYQNNKLPLLAFRNNLSYHAFDLDKLLRDRPSEAAQLFDRWLAHVEQRSVGMPDTVFPAAQAEEAFRFVAQARHIGKVVLAFEHCNVDVHARMTPNPEMNPDASYWVVGGSSGLGFEVAGWLARHGARHIVLTSRRAELEPALLSRVEAARAAGVHIYWMPADVRIRADVKRVAETLRSSLPRLQGVFHAAMVLDDAILEQLNDARTRAVLEPKLDGAWNLHEETRADDLRYFVMFSSIVSLLGNAAQAAYAAANSFLDALAHHRLSVGLPALCVNWGAVAEAGFVARSPVAEKNLRRQGLSTLPLTEALDILGTLMTHGRIAQVAVCDMAWAEWSAANPEVADAAQFGELTTAARDSTAEGAAVSIARQIEAVDSQAARAALLRTALAHEVAHILGTLPERVSHTEPLTDQGLDSLMAVGLSIWTERELGLETPTGDLMRGVNLASLAEQLLVRKAQGACAAAAGAGVAPPSAGTPSPEFQDWVLGLARDLRAARNALGVPIADEPWSMDRLLPQPAEALVSRLGAASIELERLVQNLSPEEHIVYRGFYRSQLLEFFMQSPFLRRTYEKPRGYAGDYHMMNMIYDHSVEGDTLFARAVDKYGKAEPAARGVYNRLGYMSERLNRSIERLQKPVVGIASIGCGPARDMEAFLWSDAQYASTCEILLVDQDVEALVDAGRRVKYAGNARDARFQIREMPVQHLFEDAAAAAAIGKRDIIYSTGLFDYFNDQSFARLLRGLYDTLRPGGTLCIGNVAEANPSRAFMEYALDWYLFHRTSQQLHRFANALLPAPRYVGVEAESEGVNLFLVVEK